MHVDFEDNTPLNDAALAGQSDTIKTLLEEFGCDSNIRGYSGRTLVHQACEQRALTCSEYACERASA